MIGVHLENPDPAYCRVFPVRHYDLDATLSSGQAFRWQKNGNGWDGVIGRRFVRLHSDADSITAETAEPVSDWSWLIDYLQLDLKIEEILTTFPDDEPMREAVHACHGLRLLRQDPWECLASFILSSTKQIVQIQQIIQLLCERFGDPLPALRESGPTHSFPSPARLAAAEEAVLRACKMGFRAPYLLEVARRTTQRQFDPAQLGQLPVEVARVELMKLPGVGRKIADCALLFALGFQSAFPVDVWVARALRQLYFPRRKVNLPRLHRFAATHFGPNAGYAQQYLFHYMRTRGRRRETVRASKRRSVEALTAR